MEWTPFKFWNKNKGDDIVEMGLNDIYMIVRELETCSSVKAKEHILRKNIDNELTY